MYQRIVVATDGSDTSNIAVEHAVQLAKDQRARLRIVHVVESIGYAVSMAGAYPFDPTRSGRRCVKTGARHYRRRKQKRAAQASRSRLHYSKTRSPRNASLRFWRRTRKNGTLI